MALLVDDLIIGASTAITTASVIVLLVLLARYRKLVRDAGASAELAKNIWEAMNTRFSTTDARIIDLMARVEVFSARSLSNLKMGNNTNSGGDTHGHHVAGTAVPFTLPGVTSHDETKKKQQGAQPIEATHTAAENQRGQTEVNTSTSMLTPGAATNSSSFISAPEGGPTQSQSASIQAPVPSTSPTSHEARMESLILGALSEGPRTSTQIKAIIGRSREHTARLLKTMFEQGLVIRNDGNKPYLYEITVAGSQRVT